MYFQSPRPFGQQSTSFRPIGGGSGGMRGASSLSVLTVSTFDNTGFDARPIDNSISDEFCNSTYDSSTSFIVRRSDRRNANRSTEYNELSCSQKNNISASTDNGLNKVLSSPDGTYGEKEEGGKTLFRISMPKPKHSVPRKTISLTDALSDDALNPSFSGWESSERREVPIVREPMPWSYSGENKSGFQHINSIRCMSEVPFDRNLSKPNARDIFSNNITEGKGSHTQFSTDTGNESNLFRKSSDENRFVTSAQQNPPFANSVKLMKSRLPGQISTDIMLNAALGVRAELERDPKFRSRADNLRNNRFPVKPVYSGNYKQSPSFMHLEGFLLNSPSVLQPPIVSSTFTPEKVHNLFSPSNDIPLAIVPPAVQKAPCEDNNSSTVEFKKQNEGNVESVEQEQDSVNVHSVVIQTAKKEEFRPDVVVKNFFTSKNQLGSSVVRDDSVDQSSKNIVQTSLSLNKEATESKHRPNIIIAVTPTSVASPPPSILVKTSTNYSSESAVKPVKKVVFQCDENTATTPQSNEEFVEKGETVQAQEAPPCITQYDDSVGEALSEFVKLGHQIGGDLDEAVEIVAAAFSEMRKFIWNASGQPEMTGDALSEKLSPISQNIEKMGAYTSSHRSSKLFNHLSALSDGIPALGWLAVKKTPGPHVKEMRDSALFYVNRVYKDYKEGDKTHTQWAKSWVELLTALEKYIRQVHTTGLIWNSSPGSVCPGSETSAVQSTQPAPPPPVIPEGLLNFEAPKQDTGGDRSALFAELNKGSDITKGLKKVTKDMMTHKNPALRAQGPLEPSKPKATPKAAPKKTTEPERPPKLVLENGKQWNVEYYKNKQDLVVDITDMKQTVYIYKCEGCVVQIKGKVNSVTLDGCKKTSVVFGNLLSQIEVINCQSVQIQSMGTMPTVSIQKTDGCQVYLNKESLNAEVVASKSSTMNILVPVGEEGDYQEFPIPEQFKTIFDGKKLVTTVSDIV